MCKTLILTPPNPYAGADPGFSFKGGGGRKRLCARTHITSAKPEVLGGGPGSSRVVLMVSRAIKIRLSIPIKN